MKNFFAVLGLVLALVWSPTLALATSHYSYENSEKELLSQKIHWRDFGAEAFSEAVNQNKPIFLLLTAPSWCYW